MQIDASIDGAGFFLTGERFNLAKFLMCFFCGGFDIIILIQMIYYHQPRKLGGSDDEFETAEKAATLASEC
jgi:hypothetical protein